MQFSSTYRDDFTRNLQGLNLTSRSKFIKSFQRIGKIISKNLQTNYHVLGQSSNFDSQIIKSQQNLNQPSKSQPTPLLSPNRSLYLQNYSPHDIQQNNPLDTSHIPYLITPSANTKSFRINKLLSSQITNKHNKRQKTPQLIGKLSSSKIDVIEVNQNLFLQRDDNYSQSKSRQKMLDGKSPGKIASKKMLGLGKKQQSKQPRKQKSMFEVEKVAEFFNQADIGNQSLLTQVRQKQQYLKKLIQKHRADTKLNGAFLPKKNIKQLKYNYPVSTSKTSSFKQKSPYYQNPNKNPYSPYIQKIQQNARGFKSFVSAPKYTQYQRNKSNLFNNNKSPTNLNNKQTDHHQRSSRIIGEQQILQKSRALQQMRINPQINISFTVKSPRKVYYSKLENNQKMNNSKQMLDQRQISPPRINQYSPNRNIRMNNRKAKFVDALIDPLAEEYNVKQKQQQHSEKIDLSPFMDYFSRSSNRFASINHQKSNQQSSQPQITHYHPQPINLRTKISTLKQILIQSSQSLNIQINLPYGLLNSKNIHPNTQIQQFHWLMQKVFSQMQLKPQIVTIKQYKNGVFMGLNSLRGESKLKDVDGKFNQFSSIIYHFNGKAIYVGDWKEMKSKGENIICSQQQGRQNQKNVVQGYKQGIGLEIISKKIEQKPQQGQNNQIEKTNPYTKMQIYYGQFQNSLKNGYGLLQEYIFNPNIQTISQTTQIGCWKDDKKHGWVKTYKNGQLVENAQYDHNVLVKRRIIKPILSE